MKEYTVGRHAACDIRLPNDMKTVSRRHLIIHERPEEGLYDLENLSKRSTSHILINGEWRPFSKVCCRMDDPLRLGDLTTSVAQLLAKCETDTTQLVRKPGTSPTTTIPHVPQENQRIYRHPESGEICGF